jgi:hypothetical protein
MLSTKKIVVSLLVVLALAAAATWRAGWAQDARVGPPQQWEYQHLVNNNLRDLERVGLEGWELVSVGYEQNNREFYLKRPKRPSRGGN